MPSIELRGAEMSFFFAGFFEWAGSLLERYYALFQTQDQQVEEQTFVRAWILLLGICVVAHCVVLTYSFLRRIVAGSGIRALIICGCYEWVPARGLHILMYGGLWVHVIGWSIATLASAIRLLSQLDRSKTPDWRSASCWLVTSILCWGIAIAISRFYGYRFINVDPPPLPKVKVSVNSIGSYLDVGDTSQIGTERFPSDISPFFHLGVFVRQILRLIGILAFLLQLFIAMNLESAKGRSPEWLITLQRWQYDLRTHYYEIVAEVRSWDIPKSASLIGAYFATTLLVIVLCNNKHYLLLRFRTILPVTYGLAVVVWIFASGLGPVGQQNYSIPYLVSLVLVWFVTRRWHLDLRLVSQMQRRKRYLVPISEWINKSVASFISSIQKDKSCRLPEMDATELSSRITRGAFNIEETDPFVTRFFGRFMRIAKVAAERCTSASLRLMTINRYTQLGEHWPSYASLRDPMVPIWDEDLFPIRAPDGFVNWTDSIILSNDWNPVYYCPRTETRLETYYEDESYWDSSTNSYRTRSVSKTRTVEVTCSKCGGSGALEYARFLVTTWKTNRPTVVEPAMSMPELAENAEEIIYYQRRLIEAGKSLVDDAQGLAADGNLNRLMERSGSLMFDNLHWICKQVREYTQDAYVFRADYIIGGFHAMNIRFAFLRSRSGWFFGKRPEFHFGQLPIGWASVASWLFLPPIALTVWALIAGIMIGIVSMVLNSRFPIDF
jgi:hypothetical protein